MTVALFMSDPHQVDGHDAYCVRVHDAATGRLIGGFVTILSGVGVSTFILPTGRKLDSRRHSIDEVIRAIVRSAGQEGIAA